MHGTIAEAEALAGGLAAAVGARTDRTVILGPPSTALSAVVRAVEGTEIAVAAQNMHFEQKGAFTGEVSPTMLNDLGVSPVSYTHLTLPTILRV